MATAPIQSRGGDGSARRHWRFTISPRLQTKTVSAEYLIVALLAFREMVPDNPRHEFDWYVTCTLERRTFPSKAAQLIVASSPQHGIMDSEITRRDFLGSTLLASGAALLGGASPAQLLQEKDEFTGYGGVGEYSASNGNTLPVLR